MPLNQYKMDFKYTLETPSYVKIDVCENNKMTINEAHEVIKAYDYKKKVSTIAPYDEEMLSALTSVHADIVDYWNPYGFLTLSSMDTFMGCVSKCIYARRIDEPDIEADALFDE